jgi:hemerythrin-like metal-binding protein
VSNNKKRANEATAIVAIPHDLDRRDDMTGAHTYSPEWETKVAISSILDIVLKPIGFKRQLEEILDIVVSISWLRAEKKGAIFVVNSRKQLVLTVQHDLHEQLLRRCALVPFGRCLCGKAAAEKRILFRTCVDGDHEIRFPGMQEHGHYNIPLLDNQGEVIGVIVLYLEHGHKPHREEKHFTAMLGRTVSNVLFSRQMQLKSEISNIRLQKAQLDMMHKLVAASEFRDNETGEHIKRLSLYAAVIGRHIGLSVNDVRLLELSIPMHDIGKMGIADSILLKPGKLTADEYSIMQGHTDIGAQILSGDHPLMQASREIAQSHHEKWDGSGYPQGLSGEGIPLFARICALVDVFDALTTKRPYKEPWPLAKTLSHIEAGAGSHFDPHLVHVFKQCLPDILKVQSLYGDSDWHRPAGDKLSLNAVTDEAQDWKAEYSVGVDAIDDQHKYLLNLIGRIDIATEDSDAAAIVEAIVDVRRYAEIHFVEEEDLMREIEYPDLDNHKAMHQRFLEKANEFLDELEQNPLAVSAEISNYLSNWWTHHIKKTDAKFARHLLNHETV